MSARGKWLLAYIFASCLIVFSSYSFAAPNVCGDGKCRAGETAATCPQDCTADICGDGICGTTESYDICPADCPPPPPATCNNDGVCNEGEDCLSCPSDCAGVTSGKPGNRYCCGRDTCDAGLCGADCGAPPSEQYCGDGDVNQPVEECDDGGETAFCNADCTFAICGDAKLNPTSGEECDTGGETAACDIDCTLPECGDDMVNVASGEECDDGNLVPGDGCDELCRIEFTPEPYCGDGAVNQASEECDDGNTLPGDGCDAACRLEPASSLAPPNQFNIGDSIGEGEAANGTIGDPNHETVWSTGYDTTDSVNALNERFEAAEPQGYLENNASRDPVFNHAESGAVMADFAGQVNGILTALYQAATPDEAGMITILLGNNDVCAGSLGSMTDPVLFESQYRAGLDVLVNSPLTSSAVIHVSSIPAIYWLWNAKRTNFVCTVFVWPFVPCQNLLANAGDDCASSASRLDPDHIYTGDGSNCIRRKTFHAMIRDIYNPILRNVLQEYIDDGRLPNAYFTDIFSVRFDSVHVNNGDCFHPSETGHGLLSEEQWCGSPWGSEDQVCIP